MTEASCAKCHKGEVFVPEADDLNLAYGTCMSARAVTGATRR